MVSEYLGIAKRWPCDESLVTLRRGGTRGRNNRKKKELACRGFQQLSFVTNSVESKAKEKVGIKKMK